VKCWLGRISFFFFLFAAITICSPAPVYALNKAEISDMEVSKSGKDLEVSFHLVDCFNSDMEEAILDGVPTSFRIIVSLEKPSLFLRSKVADFSVRRTIKYNRLNNEFQVELQEHPQTALVTKNFEEAKRWMSTVENLPVVPTCWLAKDQEYYLSVKAELSKVGLPLFLRYILFWVSLWDFETEWHTVMFLY
jgi:hypothetical protein